MSARAGFQRREFLASLAGLAALPWLPGTAGAVLREFWAAEGGGDLPEVLEGFWKPLPGAKTQCFICPLECVLEDGQTCFCRTRTNQGGRLKTIAFGNPCLLALDPVEKVPLNHFLPGSSTLALGTGGCNLRCLYCQNWEQSQRKPTELRNHDLPPEKAADSTAASATRVLAFTYTEPVAFLEYLCAIAERARKQKVRTVAATALFATPDAARHMGRHLDAACVAIKGFSEEFYDRVCGSRLAPVLAATKALAETGVHLEVTTLVVPGYNDDLADLRRLAEWIVQELGPDTPWHLARFVPEYRLNAVPRTPIEDLERARAAGLEAGLRYVYLANVAPHEGNHTECPGCGRRLVERLGFKLLRNDLEGGRCPSCRRKIPGVWKA